MCLPDGTYNVVHVHDTTAVLGNTMTSAGGVDGVLTYPLHPFTMQPSMLCNMAASSFWNQSGKGGVASFSDGHVLWGCHLYGLCTRQDRPAFVLQVANAIKCQCAMGCQMLPFGVACLSTPVACEVVCHGSVWLPFVTSKVWLEMVNESLSPLLPLPHSILHKKNMCHKVGCGLLACGVGLERYPQETRLVAHCVLGAWFAAAA